MQQYRTWRLISIAVFTTIVFSISCTDKVAPFLISDNDEVQLGNTLRKEINNDTDTYPPFTGDAKISTFIDSLGQLLADIQQDRDTLTFTFTIIEKDEINAFAIPGGHVYIYTGLLSNARSGAEIAGVLAHEIGHIAKYHGRNQLLNKEMVGYVNSILFGDSSSIAGALTGLLENMAFLSFSRNNEFQADSCAVRYTALAGINPEGMSIFLKKLREKYGEEPAVFEPFSSHPPLKDRIERVEALIDKVSSPPAHDSAMYVEEYLAIRDLL